MVNIGIMREGRIFVPVTFCLIGRLGITIQFVVDTGFTEYLSLPSEALRLLRLALLHTRNAGLADGSKIDVEVYDATILWNGIEQFAPVLALGYRALLGMKLLQGYEFCAQVVEGGLVTLEPLNL